MWAKVIHLPGPLIISSSSQLPYSDILDRELGVEVVGAEVATSRGSGVFGGSTVCVWVPWVLVISCISSNIPLSMNCSLWINSWNGNNHGMTKYWQLLFQTREIFSSYQPFDGCLENWKRFKTGKCQSFEITERGSIRLTEWLILGHVLSLESAN